MIDEVAEIVEMPKFKDQCYDEFIDDCNKFNSMVDELITVLDEAIENAAGLEQWEVWPSSSVPEA